jgi:hypothetical protein
LRKKRLSTARPLWLDRHLITGPVLVLCLTEAAFGVVMRDCKIPRNDWGPWIQEGANATMHSLTDSVGEMVCAVCLQTNDKVVATQIAGLLVHEAVHVWQKWRESIGEKEPSKEFEAYGIQQISQRLMHAYAQTLP